MAGVSHKICKAYALGEMRGEGGGVHESLFQQMFQLLDGVAGPTSPTPPPFTPSFLE